MNEKDLPLIITYMTWVMISALYFMWSTLGVKSWRDDSALVHRVNAWFLLGVMFAVATPSIIKATSSILVIMFTAL